MLFSINSGFIYISFIFFYLTKKDNFLVTQAMVGTMNNSFKNLIVSSFAEYMLL